MHILSKNGIRFYALLTKILKDFDIYIILCYNIAMETTDKEGEQMRQQENAGDWLSEYLRDIMIANRELAENNFSPDPESIICDIYVLPSHNHQTYYGKIMTERGFYKIVYAKAIQNSIWFSEPIYMYRFEEAKRFENHPMKKGRIVCRAKMMDKALINRLLFTSEKLADKQPIEAIRPFLDGVFTAVRIYENGSIRRRILYSDPDKLEFRDSTNKSDAVEFLAGLYLSVEKIIGIGE